MRYWNLFFVALIGLLTACSAEEVVTNDYVKGDCSLNIEVTQGNLTRVDHDGMSATFEADDVIGLYAVNENGVTEFSNIAFTYNGSSWTAASDVVFDPDWSYYAYYPYVASPYTPDFSQSTVDTKFATFIADASDKFHLANQSTKANLNASDLMIAQGAAAGMNTIKFDMDHKKALALIYVNGAAAFFTPFGDNKPYFKDGKGYFCMKPNTTTTIAGYELSAAGGKCVKCVLPDIDAVEQYLTFQALASGTFSVNLAQGTFYYSKNGGDWTAYSSAVSVSSGDMVRWKGEITPSSLYGVGVFVTTCNFNVGGNSLSLLYGDDFAGRTNISGKPYAFYQLFYNNTHLKSVEYLALPATTLAENCYKSMFKGCTSLTTAPVLPATALSQQCYYDMFMNCTSLTTAPDLPATTLAGNCYNQMFNGCTGLTTAPELPATTLADNCYNGMFYGCTGLTTAPELPATTLASYCYISMFNGCTGLTTAPELPATTLANSCYNNMFSGCTALTTAPELPATTLAGNCYQQMFLNCTGLTTAPELPVTTLASYCYTSMFNGCTGLTTAPELPATTLAAYCYVGMFQNCTSLTTAPELPATTLANSCYNYMFRGCSNLNYIKAMFTTTPASLYTNSWVDGVASSGTFVKNSAATWSVTGVHGIPSNWTVETASE